MLTDIKSTIDGLNSILTELVEVHKRLTACVIELRDALVACDHETIDRLTRESEKISAEARRLEGRRIGFLREAGLEDGSLQDISSIEKVLMEIELSVEEREAFESLKALRSELAEHIHRVDHHNQLNLTLVGQALEYHNYCLQLLVNAASGDTTGYTPDGPSRSGEGTGFIDGRA
jgi:flagellar biosynthesis/type III secretory pathway chaperone